jgi:iron complex outermembrane receptor protein
LVLTGGLNCVGWALRENVGNSYRLGLEIDASIQLSDKLSVQPNISVSSNKNVDFVFQRDGAIENLGNTDIAFSPELVAGNIFSYQPISNFRASLLSKYVSDQYMGNINSETSKLEGYFTNDINLQYEIKTNSFIESIVLNALVNNIFNVKYNSYGYFYTYDDDFSNPGSISTIEGAAFYPMATTNYLIGATLKF